MTTSSLPEKLRRAAWFAGDWADMLSEVYKDLPDAETGKLIKEARDLQRDLNELSGLLPSQNTRNHSHRR